jgi:hypothetical protein
VNGCCCCCCCLLIKWKVRKGYLKIHVVVAVDIKKKKNVSFDVTSEVHEDGRMLK